MLSAVLVVAGPSADAQADWSQIGVDIDGETADDLSGWSVAMNAAGDTVIIGAPYNDGNGDNAGQARVFTLTDGVGGCRSVPISTAKPQTICPAGRWR